MERWIYSTKDYNKIPEKLNQLLLSLDRRLKLLTIKNKRLNLKYNIVIQKYLNNEGVFKFSIQSVFFNQTDDKRKFVLATFYCDELLIFPLMVEENYLLDSQFYLNDIEEAERFLINTLSKSFKHMSYYIETNMEQKKDRQISVEENTKIDEISLRELVSNLEIAIKNQNKAKNDDYFQQLVKMNKIYVPTSKISSDKTIKNIDDVEYFLSKHELQLYLEHYGMSKDNKNYIGIFGKRNEEIRTIYLFLNEFINAKSKLKLMIFDSQKINKMFEKLFRYV